MCLLVGEIKPANINRLLLIFVYDYILNLAEDTMSLGLVNLSSRNGMRIGSRQLSIEFSLV